jgi:carboxymethylenebutenolidase
MHPDPDGDSLSSDPLETRRELILTALAAGRSHSAIAVYPDAGHACSADDRPSDREDAAQDGWTWARARTWFAAHRLAPSA